VSRGLRSVCWMRRAWLLMALLLLAGCGRIAGGSANVSPSFSPTVSPSPTAASPSPSPSPSGTCTSGVLPAARILGAFAYMASVQQAVLFGGHDASNNLLNDTWARKSGCWTELHPSQSPPANTIVASAYDANTGVFVVLLYGPSGGPTYLDLTTWLWDGQSWRSPAVVSPSVSAGQAAYDKASGRVILFAMADAGGAAETWAWDGSKWSLLSPSTLPIARFNAAMVSDPATNKILLFGGVAGASGALLGDTWTWDGTQWAKLAPQASPPPRQEAAAAPFSGQGKSIVVGGLGSTGGVLDDAWQWDGVSWSTIPSFGANCCSVAIDDQNEVVVFGGGSDRATNQTQSWNGSVWTTA
jgi:hypothetical protein